MTFARLGKLGTALAGMVGIAILASAPLHAADITLHASAIDAGLKKEVFRAEGRYLLSGDLESCSYAYLEKPVHQPARRPHLRAHALFRPGRRVERIELRRAR